MIPSPSRVPRTSFFSTRLSIELENTAIPKTWVAETLFFSTRLPSEPSATPIPKTLPTATFFRTTLPSDRPSRIASPSLSMSEFFSTTFASEPATVIPWRRLSRRVSDQMWFPSASSSTRPVWKPSIVPPVTSTPVCRATRTPAPVPAPETVCPPRSSVTPSSGDDQAVAGARSDVAVERRIGGDQAPTTDVTRVRRCGCHSEQGDDHDGQQQTTGRPQTPLRSSHGILPEQLDRPGAHQRAATAPEKPQTGLVPPFGQGGTPRSSPPLVEHLELAPIAALSTDRCSPGSILGRQGARAGMRTGRGACRC